MKRFSVNVFLPAAGLGERLRPITNHLPKPLLPILGKPIIDGILGKLTSVCTGDIGTIAAKKYDLEAWFPRTKSYGEVVSCSNCTDYQARRLNVRCGKVGGEKRFLHTLNSTAIATSRALRAIFENYQRADGSLEVPPVLREYMGGLERIEPGATSNGKK